MSEGSQGGAVFDKKPTSATDISAMFDKYDVYYVSPQGDDATANGSLSLPYKTIQAAINAVANGVIMINPGTYNENLVLKANVHLRSFFNNSFYTVYINGEIKCEHGAGKTMLNGLNVKNTVNHVLNFRGTGSQKLFAYNCKFESNSPRDHHAVKSTNSHADSEMFFRDCLLQVLQSYGGALCLNTVALSKCKIGVDNTSLRIIDHPDHIALLLKGSVSYWHRMDEIRGWVDVQDTASCNLSLMALNANTLSCLNTNSSGLTILSSVILSTTASPAVTGAGVFVYSSVGYGLAGTGFAGTLNGGAGPDVGALSGESALNSIYDNTASGLTATRVKTVIDELYDRFKMLNGIVNPNGGVTGYYGQCYHDTVTGNLYKCVSSPTGTVWTAI